MGQKRRWILRILVSAVLFGLCFWQVNLVKETFRPAGMREFRIILDAGHGGEDGGAVSPNGTKESGLNLSITLRLDQMLGFLGEPPLLLRHEDISLHQTGAQTLREKKVSDLKTRVGIASEYPEALLISIHQNTYPKPQYHGAQVFYAATPGSQSFAKAVQSTLAKHLQPENTRQEKQIPESVYLMNHIENPAILVECGFLTNPEEEQLLLRDDYQKKLALLFGSEIIRFAAR